MYHDVCMYVFIYIYMYILIPPPLPPYPPPPKKGVSAQVLQLHARGGVGRRGDRYSIYLLYWSWNQSTNTDAEDAACVLLRWMFLADVLGKFMPGKRFS